MNFKKLITGILIIVFAFALPVSTYAQEVDLGGATEKLVPVPISDHALRSKEVGITIFGITIPGVTLDGIVLAAAKILIKAIMDATIKWVNSGFDGNPLYATDPRKFLINVADQTAGKFIDSSDLGFLCSPFQAKIRLALRQYYRGETKYQCTLTSVISNIESFYDDFDQGGLDAWFSMTQNNVNNPYGALLESTIELDRRVVQAVGLEDTQLKWNSGFLSWRDCTDSDPYTGECQDYGPVKTPGKVIEGQLEGVLGTELKQLELADELDELITALFGQLMKKLLSGGKSLFN